MKIHSKSGRALRNITNMLRKDVKIKWDSESRQSFEQIK
jgi:hypothetical protein